MLSLPAHDSTDGLESCAGKLSMNKEYFKKIEKVSKN
jgi:hypothetical protein